MFINLDKELKTIQKKNLDLQECTQKYLVADSGNRVMNDAFKSIQNKKKSKKFPCKKCTKEFLSFPALKEHSKKNHGFQPLQNGEVRKRGRPRRDVIKPSDQFLQWEQQEAQLPQKPKRPSSLDTYTSNILDRLEIRKDRKSAIDQLLFSLESQLEEEYIQRTLEELNKNEDDNVFYLEKNSSVSYLLTAFLINVAQFSSDEILQVMIVFVKSIYYYIDNYARDDLFKVLTDEEYGLVPPINNSKRFHELMSIQTFPLILNNYLTFLPHFLESFPIIYASRLLKEICEWSYKECGGFKIYDNI